VLTNDFIAWERSSRDVIDVKRCYIDIAGDIAAGVLLSQIVYYFLPDRTGNSKHDVERDGRLWIARFREQWQDECCMSPKQFDRCCAELEKRGLIITDVFKRDTNTVKHISLNWENLIARVEIANSLKGNSIGIPQRVIPTSYSKRENLSLGLTTKKREIPFSDEQVEGIYQAYPRKKARGTAHKAIRAALMGIYKGDFTEALPAQEAYEVLLAKTEEYAASPEVKQKLQAKEQHFIPHPATWFNAKSYMDEQD